MKNAATTPGSREREETSLSLAQLSDAYWAFRIREFPVEASGAGISSADALMDGAAAEDHVRRARECRAMLRRADAIVATDLADGDLITFQLLRGQLELIVEEHDCDAPYRPALFPLGFIDVPMMLAQQTPLVTFEQRETFAQRLGAVPRFLDDSFAVLKEGFERGYRLPRALVPRLLSSLDAYVHSGLEEALAKSLAADIPGVEASELTRQRERILVIVRKRIGPILRELRDAIQAFGDRELCDSPSLADQPGGREFYRHKIREQTSRDLDPDAVHELGLTEIARIQGELDEVLKAMGRAGEREAVAREFDSRVANDRGALLTETRAIAKRIDGLLPRLFGMMPRITYGVEQMTPEQSASLPPAYAQPAPADRTLPGIYWLTALPNKCPLYLLIPLTLHEAWPGHLMQMALAHELADLPEFRRYGWAYYNGYVEGWALYCERLGHELSLYTDPHDHFGLLTLELWRAARLVVDTGIHWKQWTRDAAINYMAANTFLPAETIESEVDRYIGMPAQALSYKIGERTISDLRQRGSQELGRDFSLRRFHDHVLSLGPVSLAALEAETDRWIARSKVMTEPPERQSS